MSQRVNHSKKFTYRGFSLIDLIPNKERVTKKKKKKSHWSPTQAITVEARNKVEQITT